MLTRRGVLGSLGAGALVAAQRGPSKKPNFLFILGDDHAGHVLGAAGNRLAETPNLDRLASQGTRFERHYCNSPVCTPSRQSMLTGQLPHASGVTVLSTQLSEDKPTVSRQLKTAGYQTAVVGKMHFNRPSRPGLHGFDFLMTEQDVQKAWAARKASRTVPDGIRTKPAWRPFKDPARIWLNAEKLPFGRYYEDMRGTFIARQACQYLEENQGRQFALWVSLQEPHSPFDFPVDDRDRFAPSRFPVPRVGSNDGWQIPLIFRDLSDAEKQGIIAAYYTSVAFLDRNVGVVLDRLRALGLEENTYVVYVGDNGYMLGEHGRFEKHCGYEPAIHVPLIMRLPGRIRQGVAQDLTECVDIAPTVFDMLGVDPLPVLHGQSLRPYLEGKRPSRPRDHIFSEYLENEEAFVRDDRWKLIVSSGRRRRTDGYETDKPRPGRYVILFDRQNDPGEFENVASKHPEIVARMEERMLTRFRQTHPDSGGEPQRLSREEAIEWYLRPRDAKL